MKYAELLFFHTFYAILDKHTCYWYKKMVNYIRLNEIVEVYQNVHQ